ncbi:MAG: hypothetical protein ACFFCS_17925 [Candidatus Hodarchaeota archaeon]
MTKPSSFEVMLERLAKTTQFKTFNDVLKDAIVEEYERKYKNYPRFRSRLASYWKGYTSNQVAKVIFDHVEDIFRFWFGTIFKFDLNRLKILEPNVRSDVDFNAKFQYLYTNEEMKFIDKLIEKYDIKFMKTPVVLNQLVLTCLRVLGPIIEDYFGRPYDFQPENIDDEDTKDGKLVKIFFSSREA